MCLIDSLPADSIAAIVFSNLLNAIVLSAPNAAQSGWSGLRHLLTQGCAPFRVCAIMRTWTDRAASTQQAARQRAARRRSSEKKGSNSSSNRQGSPIMMDDSSAPPFSPYAEFVRLPDFATLPARLSWVTSLLQRICSELKLATQLEQGKPLQFRMDNALQQTDQG